MMFCGAVPRNAGASGDAAVRFVLLTFHPVSYTHLDVYKRQLSDKGSHGEREDKSGPLIVEMLTATGYKVCLLSTSRCV